MYQVCDPVTAPMVNLAKSLALTSFRHWLKKFSRNLFASRFVRPGQVIWGDCIGSGEPPCRRGGSKTARFGGVLAGFRGFCASIADGSRPDVRCLPPGNRGPLLRGVAGSIRRRIACRHPPGADPGKSSVGPGQWPMGNRHGRCPGRIEPERILGRSAGVVRAGRRWAVWGRLPGGAASGKFGYSPCPVDEWWLCRSDPRRLARREASPPTSSRSASRA
jgi:hypothetical protein